MVSGKLVVPATVVIVAVAAVAVIVLANRDDTRAAAGSPSTGSPSTSHGPGQLTSAAASRLANDVTSGDEKRVRAVVAVSPEQPLDAGAVSALAAIEAMSFDVRTFRDLGDGTAEVTARVDMPGAAQPTGWTVRLVAVNQEWLISSTESAQ
jgi:hypothetical protein